MGAYKWVTIPNFNPSTFITFRIYISLRCRVVGFPFTPCYPYQFVIILRESKRLKKTRNQSYITERLTLCINSVSKIKTPKVKNREILMHEGVIYSYMENQYQN